LSTCSDPRRLAGDRERRDREVHLVGVVEQRLLDDADDRRAQPRRRRLRQRDAVPGDVGFADDGDHDRSLGQERSRGVAVRVELDAVVAGRVRVLAPARRSGGIVGGAGAQALALRKLEDEGRHRRARRLTRF
jgi:hypothetical protein